MKKQRRFTGWLAMGLEPVMRGNSYLPWFNHDMISGATAGLRHSATVLRLPTRTSLAPRPCMDRRESRQ